MTRSTPRSRSWPVGLFFGVLLVAGCAGTGAPAGGANTGRTAPTPDTSTSTVTDVCSVVTNADLDSAFGGTWYPDPASNTDPLTCNYTDFQSTQGQASSLLKPGSAVTIELWPNYYATSDMGHGQNVADLGEQASILGNTLTIKRGADVILILAAPADASPAVQGAMVALGRVIYPRF